MAIREGVYTPPPEVFLSGSATYAGLFKESAFLNSDRTALIEGARALTYAELDERSNRMARVLLDKGLGRGERLGVLTRNCIEFIEIEIAAAKIGVISVNLNWRQTPSELAHCANLTRPSFVVSSEEFVGPLREAGWQTDLVIGTEYDAALNAVEVSDPPDIRIEGEDGLCILFTSGTTGMPKGALISHRAMVARSLIFATETGAPKDDTFIAWSPLYHMGSNDFTLATLLRGGQILIIDGYDSDKMIDAIEQYTVHYLTVVPGMIEDFITQFKARDAKPKPIGLIGAMADLVPRPLLREITTLLNAPYFNTFGSTETGTPPASASFIPVGEAPESLSKRQNDFCQVRLVDANDNDVADGDPGELAIRGPSVFSGYWGNDAANEEAFRGGWFHMGDVFRRNPDGTLDFVDRVKYMIKSGGENIYPAEIEQHIMLDERIMDVAVVRKTHQKWGEVPVVFAASNDESLTPEDVIGMCKGRVANYKLPKEVYFIQMDELPRSTSGKIQRHILEERLK